VLRLRNIVASGEKSINIRTRALAEAKFKPAFEAKDREIEALRRKLREAGIGG
jgi:hypothetical protein